MDPQFSNYALVYHLDDPIACEWGNWEIGDCSKSCGGGTRTNSRQKILEESNGGKCDGTNTIQENCNEQKCSGRS